MAWRRILAAFLLAALALAPRPGLAGACEAAAGRAEQAYGLPAGLLEAIGRVETGAPGRPWTIDEAARDQTLASEEAAVALARQRLRAGARSLDVGCFQVNLLYHPEAFASLEEAFDPDHNAAAAARFLLALRGRLGNWAAAAASYHSSDPAHGIPYLRRVLAAWSRAVLAPEAPAIDTEAVQGPRIITFGPARPVAGLPHIIRGFGGASGG